MLLSVYFIYSSAYSLTQALIFPFQVVLTAPTFPKKQCGKFMTSPLRRVARRPLHLRPLLWLPWSEARERQECEDGADSVKSRKRGILSQRSSLFHSLEILCSYSHSAASHLLCCNVHAFSQFSRSSVYSLLLTLVWGFSAVGQTVT